MNSVKVLFFHFYVLFNAMLEHSMEATCSSSITISFEIKFTIMTFTYIIMLNAYDNATGAVTTHLRGEKEMNLFRKLKFFFLLQTK